MVLTGSYSLSPTSVSFGSATLGTTSAETDVWVTNTGTTGVSVSAITVSAPFALSRTDCSPTATWTGVLAPGTHCNVYVVFSPVTRSEEHTSQLHSLAYIACRLLLSNTNA